MFMATENVSAVFQTDSCLQKMEKAAKNLLSDLGDLTRSFDRLINQPDLHDDHIEVLDGKKEVTVRLLDTLKNRIDECKNKYVELSLLLLENTSIRKMKGSTYNLMMTQK